MCLLLFCFIYVIYLIVIGTFLYFGLLVGENKMFGEVTLHSKELGREILFFLMFTRKLKVYLQAFSGAFNCILLSSSAVKRELKRNS